MILALGVIFVALFGFSVDAQTLPDRYMVSGVASTDVLNIREDATASSDIIGGLGPNTLNVEVLRVLDGWGYVGAGERSGWVSMDFLAPNPVAIGEIPRPMACFGTEPFWSLTFYPRGTEYDDPEVGPRALTVLRERVAPNGYLIDTLEGPAVTRTLAITGLNCNDGMSDRNFGMSITMFTEAAGDNSVRTGCCTLQVN